MKTWIRRNRVVIALAFLLVPVFGSGFVVGLSTQPDQWFYDISYNPMSGHILVVFQGTIIYILSTRKGRK